MAATNLLGETIASPPAAEEKGKPQYQYRFMESGAEWALTQDGHYVVLRCGKLEPRVRVRIHAPGRPGREGKVRSLIPGTGPAPRQVIVAVVVKFWPQPTKDWAPQKPVYYIRHFRPDELEVIP